jgi:TPR repeat protein
MYFRSTYTLGMFLMIFTSISLYSSQTKKSPQVQKATCSQSSSSASSFSAPVSGPQNCHKKKAQQLTKLFQEFVSHDDEYTDLFDLGVMAEEAGHITLALAYYCQSAAAGNEGALYHLPEFYETYKTSIPDALTKRLQCLINVMKLGMVSRKMRFELLGGIKKRRMKEMERPAMRQVLVMRQEFQTKGALSSKLIKKRRSGISKRLRIFLSNLLSGLQKQHIK